MHMPEPPASARHARMTWPETLRAAGSRAPAGMPCRHVASGRPAMSNGAPTSIISSCWIMCTEKSSTAAESMGGRSAATSADHPSTNATRARSGGIRRRSASLAAPFTYSAATRNKPESAAMSHMDKAPGAFQPRAWLPCASACTSRPTTAIAAIAAASAAA